MCEFRKFQRFGYFFIVLTVIVSFADLSVRRPIRTQMISPRGSDPQNQARDGKVNRFAWNMWPTIFFLSRHPWFHCIKLNPFNGTLTTTIVEQTLRDQYIRLISPAVNNCLNNLLFSHTHRVWDTALYLQVLLILVVSSWISIGSVMRHSVSTTGRIVHALYL